jgi:hypothetical protein
VARVRVGQGIAGQNYCVMFEGFLLSLSLCNKGFQDLLKVRPSSLFIFLYPIDLCRKALKDILYKGV